MESIINGYEIVEELRKGNFCDAYKVRKGGKEYFMKVYKDPTIMSADYEDFKNNQKTMIPILKALGNMTETIVEDFEVKEEGRYYQIKELIPGGTNLQDWLENNGDPDQRLDVAVQFCDILKAVHSKNIIHQDLKPEQVMTVADSSKIAGIRLILTDFDWAIPNGKMVRAVSTPGYANIDTTKTFQSDIFTFGIILCELLTGANPYFAAKTEGGSEIIFDPNTDWERWVKNEDYLEPIKIYEYIEPQINDIIVRCLKPNQKDRPSLDEIKNALIQPPESKEPPKLVKLIADSGDKLLMVPGMGYGRKHFKELFRNTEDGDGNLVYKYLDQTYAVLSLTQESGQLYVCSPAFGKAKNKIILNSEELSDKPTPFNNGDRISIHSTSKNADVATFTVNVV